MRNPDFEGAGGRAWELPIVPLKPDHQACLGRVLVHAPHSHPWWPWKEIYLIHLRDIPDVKPAVKSYPGAEYELGIFSIDLESCPAPDPDLHVKGYPFLHPPDVIEQFDVKNNDRDAKRIFEASIRAIVEGSISPDQDWRSVWKRMLTSTAEHFKSGAHVEN